MLVDVTRQLQGRADGLQVRDPRLGLAHNLGGAGTTASVTILGRRDRGFEAPIADPSQQDQCHARTRHGTRPIGVDRVRF